MWTRTAVIAAVLALSLADCRANPDEPNFPKANRPVAPTVSSTFSTEDARDRLGEAEEVIQLAGVRPGMWVADVGAGQGYYTVRLAPVVGAKGRVLAEDIVPLTRDQLSDRVQRERLDNVAAVVTVGANLDIDAWTQYHGYLPLTGSLNPATSTAVHRWPETHLYGVHDENVPPATADAYFKRFPQAQRRLEANDHVCCWVEQWPELWKQLAVTSSH